MLQGGWYQERKPALSLLETRCQGSRIPQSVNGWPQYYRTTFGLKCDTITMWLFAVPVGFLAAFVFHLPVVIVFLIVNLDEVVKAPAAIIHYKKYGWLRNTTWEQTS